MYAMICTHPYISHAVGAVIKHMDDPGKEHWQAIKWILCYLKGSLDVGLVFGRNGVIH